MIFLRKVPKQFFTLFEQLLSGKNIPKLYDQHVFCINRQMQNPSFFTIIAQTPSRWKHWNKSIALVHLTKQKRVPFQSYSVLQPYPLTIPTWRLALTFVFHLAKKRKSYFLFSGNYELFSLSYLFDEILAKKYNLNLAKAIDFWIPGFIGNRRSMILPVRHSVSHPPKSFSAWKLRAKTFSRKYRFNDKAFLKKLETYRFLRDSFYPECVILLNTSNRAYAAGQEGYRKKLPTIALASSDSTNFGFSGSHFVLPAAVNLSEHLHYYCFLFFIVISFAKQQFILHEHYKLTSTSIANLVYSEKYFNIPREGYFKFAKLMRFYKNLLHYSENIFFDTIVLPFATKISKKKDNKLRSKKKILSDVLQSNIDSFMTLPTKFGESLTETSEKHSSTAYSRPTCNRIGQQLYVPPTAEEKKVTFQVARKKACVIIYRTLKMFLSTFILQTVFFKSGSVLLNENNTTPVSLVKLNSLYSFTEKLVKLLLKKPSLFDFSPKEIDWQFYGKTHNDLLHASTAAQIKDIYNTVSARLGENQASSLKVNWQHFVNRLNIPSFLNRKLVFYDNMVDYKKQTLQTIFQYAKKNKLKFLNELKHSLIVDVSNSKQVKKSIPFYKYFLQNYGFLELGFDKKKIPFVPRHKKSKFVANKLRTINTRK